MTNVASKRKPILIRSSKQEGVEGGKQFAFEQRNAEQGLQADGNFTGLIANSQSRQSATLTGFE
jgi:hypothetical protein